MVLFYLLVQREIVSRTAVSSQQISCLVYQLLSLATMVSHLYKPISSSSFIVTINLPRAPAKALAMLSI